MIKVILFVSIFVLSLSTSAKWEDVHHFDSIVHKYVPEAKKGNKKRALMLSLHGCRQDNTEMMEYGNWAVSAEDWNMVVALPDATDGGVFVGCWDYFGKNQNMNKPDVNFLITLIEKLMKDPELNIDKHQVYISGYSSGGAMAMIIGCLRPDLIAGLGIAAAPSIGTKYYQSEYVATDEDKAAELCRTWAGDNVADLETQTSAIISGNRDFIVNPGYSRVNTKMYRKLTTSDLEPSSIDLKQLPGNHTKGDGTNWSDSWGVRVSQIVNRGMGHSWPSGVGPKNQGHATGKSVNFPYYLGEYLFENNRRRR